MNADPDPGGKMNADPCDSDLPRSGIVCLVSGSGKNERAYLSIQIVFLILGPSILDCTGTMVKYRYRVRVRKLSCMHDLVSVGHWLTLYF